MKVEAEKSVIFGHKKYSAFQRCMLCGPFLIALEHLWLTGTFINWHLWRVVFMSRLSVRPSEGPGFRAQAFGPRLSGPGFWAQAFGPRLVGPGFWAQAQATGPEMWEYFLCKLCGLYFKSKLVEPFNCDFLYSVAQWDEFVFFCVRNVV